MNNQQLAKDGLICEVISGSHAYGTNLPTSDFDTRGIFVAPEICIRTPFFKVEEIKDQEKEDTSLYELTNYMRLLVDQNPNILELIWSHSADVIFSTPIYKRLRSDRYNLLSSKLAYTFTGYALGQLKRIKGHNKWINNVAPVDPPQQKDFLSVVFNMTSVNEWNKKVPLLDFLARDLGNNIYALYQSTGKYWFDTAGNPIVQPNEFWDTSISTPELIVKINIDQFKAAKENWKNYWAWKKNRNIKRSELEEKFGYDTKHAMHLVRLLRIGYEALTEHEVMVKRPDAQELLAIRRGEWTYDKIVEYAEEMQEKVMSAYETTSLPRSVDINYAAELLLELQDMAWKK